MQNARVAFDPDLRIVVAGSELVCAGRRFAIGETFPWRELGVKLLAVAELYEACRVDCVAIDVTEVAIALPGVTSGELAAKIDQAERSSKRPPRARS